MPVTEQERTTDRRSGRWALYTCVALVGYVLSIGPATFLENHHLPPYSLQVIYNPLWWLVGFNRELYMTLYGYMSWWKQFQ